MTKKITEKRLYNITLSYLSRFDASSGKVRQMLRRRLIKSRLNNIDIPAEASQWIENTIEKMKRLGYIDDVRYAESQITRLSHQGKSDRYIVQKLKQDGIDASLIQAVTESSELTEAERAARFVQRKKLGFYRPKKEQEACYRKDLSALARAGFSYEVAKAALSVAVADNDVYDEATALFE